MNWSNHNSVWPTDNELISTACSPEGAGEPDVDNAKPIGKLMLFPFCLRKLFTTFARKNGRGEQVCFSEMVKFHPDTSPGPPPEKRKPPLRAAVCGEGSLSQISRCRFCGRGLFRLGGLLFSFEIARSARSFFNFVGLFAHTSVFTSA